MPLKDKKKNNEYQKEYHNNNRGRLNFKKREQFKRMADLIFDYYGNKCNCCGETQRLFLTLDHVNNDGYKYKFPSGKRITGATFFRKIIKEDFPDTIQILCMNCNHGKMRNRGICPHQI